MTSNDYYCLLDDESHCRQLHVRLSYGLDGDDPGDWTTPPCAPQLHLLDVAVLQVREFDRDGEVAKLILNADARAFDDRARELLEESPSLLARLEETGDAYN